MSGPDDVKGGGSAGGKGGAGGKAGARKIETLAVHAGSRLPASGAVPVVAPIHASVVSWYESSDELDGALDGKDYVYARISQQNTHLLEEAIAELEGAEDCVTYASGMAALRAVWDAQELKAGQRVVMPLDGYGVTRSLYKRLAAQAGVELVALRLSEKDAPARIEELKPRFVLAESVTNPLLSVPDVRALARATHAAGGRLAVDATFPSPYHQRALALGADYAVQSTTKWLNGHSDAVGGSVAGARAAIGPMRGARLFDGGVLGPFEAWLTLRGLRTLPVRMKAHADNAARLAARLAASPLLERVLYPGLPSHPDHAVARGALERGFGGMVAFEIKGADRPAGFRFLEAVRLARPGPSLGDVCSLVMHAASASARRMTPQEREEAGIKESLIRVSVGLEDPDDLADDLLQAVATAVR